jgi:hypothetical protein
MLVDRSRFLKLAVALAATTSVAATACSATPEETEGEDGTGAALTGAGGTCTSSSIKKPGLGSQQFFAYEEGFCSDLAVHYMPSPDEEGVQVRWFDFIYDQCRAYSSQLQPAVAQKVYECLSAENARRPRAPQSSDERSLATAEFNATKMYECGHDAVWSICSDGVDGRVRDRARRMAGAIRANSQSDGEGPRSLDAITQEVSAVLSGLKSSARADLETCVVDMKYDLYSCFEGISMSFYADSAFGEAAAATGQACQETGGASPALTECDAVQAKVEREIPADDAYRATTISFSRKQCNMYAKKFEPAAAREALSCLLSAKNTENEIYSCGAQGLKKVCRNPSLDAACKEIVDSVVAVDRDANKGGRLTRQCRTMLPGLKATTQAEVKTCVAPLARSFGRGSAQYAFYSCIEGLR